MGIKKRTHGYKKRRCKRCPLFKFSRKIPGRILQEEFFPEERAAWKTYRWPRLPVLGLLFCMAGVNKVCVTTRVVVGQKVIWTGGKLYDDSVTVQVVIDAAVAKAAAHEGRGLIIQSVESFQSEEAMGRRGTELDSDDLGDTQVAHLRDSFGRWLKVRAALNETEGSAMETSSCSKPHGGRAGGNTSTGRATD